MSSWRIYAALHLPRPAFQLATDARHPPNLDIRGRNEKDIVVHIRPDPRNRRVRMRVSSCV